MVSEKTSNDVQPAKKYIPHKIGSIIGNFYYRHKKQIHNKKLSEKLKAIIFGIRKGERQTQAKDISFR